MQMRLSKKMSMGNTVPIEIDINVIAITERPLSQGAI